MTRGCLPAIESGTGQGWNGRAEVQGATAMAEATPFDINDNPFDESMLETLFGSTSSTFAVSKQLLAGEDQNADSGAFLSSFNDISSTGDTFCWNHDAFSLPLLQSVQSDSGESPAAGDMVNFGDMFSSVSQPQMTPVTVCELASTNWDAEIEPTMSLSGNSIANIDSFGMNQWLLSTPGSQQAFRDVPFNDVTESTNIYDTQVQNMISVSTNNQTAGFDLITPTLHGHGSLLMQHTKPDGPSTAQFQVGITPPIGNTPDDFGLATVSFLGTSQREEVHGLGGNFDVNLGDSVAPPAPHVPSSSSTSYDFPHISLPPLMVSTGKFNQSWGKYGSIAPTTLVHSASGPVLCTSTGMDHQDSHWKKISHTTNANGGGTEFDFGDKWRNQEPAGAGGNDTGIVGSGENWDGILSPTGTLGEIDDSHSPPNVGSGSGFDQSLCGERNMSSFTPAKMALTLEDRRVSLSDETSNGLVFAPQPQQCVSQPQFFSTKEIQQQVAPQQLHLEQPQHLPSQQPFSPQQLHLAPQPQKQFVSQKQQLHRYSLPNISGAVEQQFEEFKSPVQSYYNLHTHQGCGVDVLNEVGSVTLSSVELHSSDYSTPNSPEQMIGPASPRPPLTLSLSPSAFVDLPLALSSQKLKLKMEDDLVIKSLTESRTNVKKNGRETVHLLEDMKTMSTRSS